MGTILNKIVPNRKVRIRILKDGFSSPVLGLTYIGQIKTLNIATATRFVNAGYAEFVDDTETALETSAAAPLNETDNTASPPDLSAALKMLNPDEDAHWTKDGLPDLNALKEITGKKISRKDVEKEAEGFTRESLKGE